MSNQTQRKEHGACKLARCRHNTELVHKITQNLPAIEQPSSACKERSRSLLYC